MIRRGEMENAQSVLLSLCVDNRLAIGLNVS